MLYTSGSVSLKERLLYFLNKLFIKQVKSFFFWIKILLFPCVHFTTQSASSSQVHKICPSLSCSFPTFHLTTQTISVQILIYMTLIKVLQNRSKSDSKLCPTLRAQASQSCLYSVIINQLDINYGTNWPKTKVVT